MVDNPLSRMVPNPENLATSERPRVIVAEVSFDRDATAEQLRRLGERLRDCQAEHDWIAMITCVDDLLAGKAPSSFSKAIVNVRTMQPLVTFLDPILVWAWADHPNRTKIDPVKILRAAIPADLGRVNAPDPGGGV